MLVTVQGVVEAAYLSSERDLASFVDGLKTVTSQPAPKRRDATIRRSFGFPAVSPAATFRIFVSAAVAFTVFLATLAGLVKYLQAP